MTVLILASRYDLTCDYVIAQLRRLNANYKAASGAVEELGALVFGKDALDARPRLDKGKQIVSSCSVSGSCSQSLFLTVIVV